MQDVSIKVNFLVKIIFVSDYSESDFKIENLPGGLYFFDIGSAHISTGNYELHHFYNISELLYEKNFLTNLRNEIQELTQNDALLIINLIITC